MILIWLGLAAFAAGFIDAVAGGGGLIQTPAMLIAFPKTPYPFLAGTGKISGCTGTFFSAVQYGRSFRLDFRFLAQVIPFALAFSWLGARTISHLDPKLVKPVVVVALIGVAVYTFLKPDLGKVDLRDQKDHSKLEVFLRAAGIGSVLGFYDGFIGPGTGSFLIFAFVVLLGLDFVQASATAKVVNLATNAAALLFFLPSGYFLAREAAVMTGCNVAGAFLGSHIAIKKGSEWVKRVFLVVLVVLIGRMAWDVILQR